MIEIKLLFPGDPTWTDVSSLLRYGKQEYDFCLFNDALKSCKDTYSFVLKHDIDVARKFDAANDWIKITVKEDGSDLFTGAIDPNFSQSVHDFVGDIQCDAVDNSYLLDNKLSEDINWPATIGGTPRKVMDIGDADNSIVQPLLRMAGYPVYVIEDGTEAITATVIHITHRRDELSYREIIDKLLFEHGYVFYFTRSGKFTVYKYCRESYEPEWALTEQFGTEHGLKREKAYRQFDGTKVFYADTEALDNVRLYRELVPYGTLEDSGPAFTGIEIGGGEHFPINGDITNIYQNYQTTWLDIPYLEEGGSRLRNPDISLITSSDHLLLVDKDPEIIIETQEFDAHRARVLFHNPTETIKKLYIFEIYGKALYRKTIKSIKVPEACVNPKTIKTSYLLNSDAAAIALANSVYLDLMYGDYEWDWATRQKDYGPGSIVRIQQADPDIDTNVVVTRLRYNPDSPLNYYNAKGVSEYTATPHGVEANTAPLTDHDNQTLQDQINNSPTYHDIENGYDREIGDETVATTNPGTIDVQYQVAGRSVTLRWNRPGTLTGPVTYEVYRAEEDLIYAKIATIDATIFSDYPELDMDDGLPVDTTYFYKIKTIAMGGENESTSVEVTVYPTGLDDIDAVTQGLIDLGVNTHAVVFPLGEENDTSISFNKLKVTNVDRYVQNIIDRVRTIEKKTSWDGNRFTVLGEQLDENTTKVFDFEVGIDGLRYNLAQVETDVGGNATQILQINATLDAIESTLESIVIDPDGTTVIDLSGMRQDVDSIESWIATGEWAPGGVVVNQLSYVQQLQDQLTDFVAGEGDGPEWVGTIQTQTDESIGLAVGTVEGYDTIADATQDALDDITALTVTVGNHGSELELTRDGLTFNSVYNRNVHGLLRRHRSQISALNNRITAAVETQTEDGEQFMSLFDLKDSEITLLNQRVTEEVETLLSQIQINSDGISNQVSALDILESEVYARFDIHAGLIAGKVGAKKWDSETGDYEEYANGYLAMTIGIPLVLTTDRYNQITAAISDAGGAVSDFTDAYRDGATKKYLKKVVDTVNDPQTEMTLAQYNAARDAAFTVTDENGDPTVIVSQFLVDAEEQVLRGTVTIDHLMADTLEAINGYIHDLTADQIDVEDLMTRDLLIQDGGHIRSGGYDTAGNYTSGSGFFMGHDGTFNLVFVDTSSGFDRKIQIGHGFGLKAVDGNGKITHDIPKANMVDFNKYGGHIVFAEQSTIITIIMEQWIDTATTKSDMVNINLPLSGVLEPGADNIKGAILSFQSSILISRSKYQENCFVNINAHAYTQLNGWTSGDGSRFMEETIYGSHWLGSLRYKHCQQVIVPVIWESGVPRVPLSIYYLFSGMSEVSSNYLISIYAYLNGYVI